MLRSLIAVAAAVCVVGACTTTGINLRVDDRVQIVHPEDRETVTLPVEVRWTVQGFDTGERPGSGDGNYFAVFIDREPMAPGRDLRSVTDDLCKQTPGCPDAAWLADHHIYLTAGTHVVVPAVPDTRSASRTGARDVHEAVIVLVDAENRRIGESAFSVEFVVERNAPEVP